MHHFFLTRLHGQKSDVPILPSTIFIYYLRTKKVRYFCPAPYDILCLTWIGFNSFYSLPLPCLLPALLVGLIRLASTDGLGSFAPGQTGNSFQRNLDFPFYRLRHGIGMGIVHFRQIFISEAVHRQNGAGPCSAQRGNHI